VLTDCFAHRIKLLKSVHFGLSLERQLPLELIDLLLVLLLDLLKSHVKVLVDFL
jgi:hypothetical protein